MKRNFLFNLTFLSLLVSVSNVLSMESLKKESQAQYPTEIISNEDQISGMISELHGFDKKYNKDFSFQDANSELEKIAIGKAFTIVGTKHGKNSYLIVRDHLVGEERKKYAITMSLAVNFFKNIFGHLPLAVKPFKEITMVFSYREKKKEENNDFLLSGGLNFDENEFVTDIFLNLIKHYLGEKNINPKIIANEKRLLEMFIENQEIAIDCVPGSKAFNKDKIFLGANAIFTYLNNTNKQTTQQEINALNEKIKSIRCHCVEMKIAV